MGKRKIGRMAGYASLSVVGVLGLAMLFPAISTGANAESLTASGATEFNAKVNPSIAISVPDSFNLDFTLGAGSSFAKTTGTIAVSTNSVSGYRLLIQSLNSSDMTSRDSSATMVISTVGEAVKPSEFEKNTWGYYLGENDPTETTAYSPMSTTALEAVNSGSLTEAGERKDYQLAFGVNIDESLPAGTYSNTILLSAVANPAEIQSLMDVTFMQDMTAEICAKTASAYDPATGKSDSDSEYYLKPITKQLVDIRDGNKYWVAKLADGNCWMTQNLALNLGEEPEGVEEVIGATSRYVKTLTPYDSDVVENWTVERGTEVEIPLPNTHNNADMRSWNLGKIVLSKPTNSTNCPGQDPDTEGVPGETYPGKDAWNSAFTGQKITETCGGQFVDVSDGWIADADVYTSTSSIDEANKKYDSHYLIGNYYQYGTATAGTGIGLTGTDAMDAEGGGLTNTSGSVCPKGWQLPRAGRNISSTETMFGVGPGESYDIEGSFYRLLKTYGYDGPWVVHNNGGGGYMSIRHANRLANLSGNPMYFVRSGFINTNFGSLRGAGDAGYDWSSTIVPRISTSSYELNFNTNDVYPSHDYEFYRGIAVRCIVK